MNDQNRVLVRKGARDLNEQEVAMVCRWAQDVDSMHPGCSRHA